MSLQAHIQQLEQQHQSLEAELASLTASPSVEDVRLTELKRKKLLLKDKISRLKTETH